MRIYVAAPYEDAAHVRGLHERLRSLGLEPTSHWAENAAGPENFASFTPMQLRAIAESNDTDVISSTAVLVLARAGAGGEMFAEARLALFLAKPVYWVGRRTLSSWREGVVRCEDLDDALARLVSR